MKKCFSFLVVLCFSIVVNAQTKTYSSCDTNLDGSVTVADINKVISEICSTSVSQRVIPIDSVCRLVRSLDPNVAAILEKELGAKSPDTKEYVDLGLPSGTLWATCNVGACTPEEYGLYFAWGETTGYTSYGLDGHTFNWTNYKWCKGTYNNLVEYCTDSDYGTVDNKVELGTVDDAVTANWGSKWQMPTYDQITELYNSSYTKMRWTICNDIFGMMITSLSNGNSLFLPAAGYRYGGSISGSGSRGFYWSRSLNSDYCISAYNMNFNSSDISWGTSSRYCGLPVRAIYVNK